MYEKSGKRGDIMLMRQIMESGTLSDKVSALTIRIKEHPKFCVDALGKLLSIVNSI